MLFPNADVVVNPAILVLLGLIAGTLSSFFGVGGGFLVTGGLLVLGVPPSFAVGTGLTLIMGTSIISTLKHRRLGHVDFKLGSLLVGGTIPGVFLAWRLNSTLEAAGLVDPVIRCLYVVLPAALGLFIVYDYWRGRRISNGRPGEVSTVRLAQRVQSLRIPPSSLRIPGLGRVHTYVSLPVSGIERISVFILLGAGCGVGFFAGLLGAGGGFLLMPALIYVLGIPTTVAIGTDLFQIIVTGSVGTFLYSLSNHVDPLMAVIMLVATSAGAQLGAAATEFVDAARIRVLFGLTVLSGSVDMTLQQAAESGGGEWLSTLASVLLLAVAGAICIVIAAMMIAAKRSRPEPEQIAGGGNGHPPSQDSGPSPETAATQTPRNPGDS